MEVKIVQGILLEAVRTCIVKVVDVDRLYGGHSRQAFVLWIAPPPLQLSECVDRVPIYYARRSRLIGNSLIGRHARHDCR
jgi:hypothetical protein